MTQLDKRLAEIEGYLEVYKSNNEPGRLFKEAELTLTIARKAIEALKYAQGELCLLKGECECKVSKTLQEIAHLAGEMK